MIAQGHPRAREPRAPRRLRLRSRDRRRRRHPDPAARPLLAPRGARASASSSRRPGAYAVGQRVPLDGPGRGARGRRRSLRAGSCATRASACSAGATCPTTRTRSAAWRARALPRIRQLFVGRGAGRDQDAFERKLYVMRRVVENAARRARAASSTCCSLSTPDARLPGHAEGDADRALLPRPHRPGRRVGARARALALQHQHDARLGRSRTRSATSRTTARSTRCAATRTGCTPARARCAPTLFGDDLRKLYPIMREGASDSAQLRQRARVPGAHRAASCPRRS